MKPFITVSLILDALKNERTSGSSSGPRLEDQPKFREWKEGFTVQHKNDRSSTFRITKIKDPQDGTAGYGSTITLTNVDDTDETRTLRGATVQTSYQFLSRGDVPLAAEEVKKTLKPMTIAVDTIRSFAPRTKGRPGSRIVLKDGASYPCAEDHDTLLAAIGSMEPVAA
jgi:hypothetical protein